LLHGCYTFINLVKELQRMPWWDSALSVLRSVLALVPGLAAPKGPVWLGKVIAVDTSPYGCGDIAGRWSAEQAGVV